MSGPLKNREMPRKHHNLRILFQREIKPPPPPSRLLQRPTGSPERCRYVGKSRFEHGFLVENHGRKPKRSWPLLGSMSLIFTTNIFSSSKWAARPTYLECGASCLACDLPSSLKNPMHLTGGTEKPIQTIDCSFSRRVPLSDFALPGVSAFAPSNGITAVSRPSSQLTQCEFRTEQLREPGELHKS